jgi:15-cis-phytoene synthase
MNPQDYVAQKAASSGSSFYYAFLFLPPVQRAAITAFYAFCREIDDVVDEVSDPSVAAQKLAWWRQEVAASFKGQPSHPAMRALIPHASSFHIQATHLSQLIDGCQMDLEQSRYLDFKSLAKYCHLVAGVVGEVTVQILGARDDVVRQYAHKMGLAMQLTNIIRDVGDDARRGRIYLPMSELEQFNVRAHEILNRGYSERFTALMKFQAQRAHGFYDDALALLPADQKKSQKVGLMMGHIYRTLLREVEAAEFQVLHQRIALTPVRKLWIAMKTNWLKQS